MKCDPDAMTCKHQCTHTWDDKQQCYRLHTHINANINAHTHEMTNCQRGQHALQRNESDVADDDFGLEGAGDVAWIWGLGFGV